MEFLISLSHRTRTRGQAYEGSQLETSEILFHSMYNIRLWNSMPQEGKNLARFKEGLDVSVDNQTNQNSQ